MTWRHIEASRETVLYNQEREDTASEIRVGKKCCMIDMKRNLFFIYRGDRQMTEIFVSGTEVLSDVKMTESPYE